MRPCQEACAVILSSKVGAISMIKDGYNGLHIQGIVMKSRYVNPY